MFLPALDILHMIHILQGHHKLLMAVCGCLGNCVLSGLPLLSEQYDMRIIVKVLAVEDSHIPGLSLWQVWQQIALCGSVMTKAN